MTLNKKLSIGLVTSLLLISNSKVILADDEVIKVEKNQVLTCEEYYNRKAEKPFLGEVVKKGHYIVEKDPNTYLLTKRFVLESVTVNCTSNPAVEKEYRFIDCEGGLAGDQKQYRNYINNENLETRVQSITYPNGENWITIEENCLPEEKNEDEDVIKKQNLLFGLFTGAEIKTSELKKGSDYQNYMISLQKSTINNHRLNLAVDNLSANEYNASNVTNAIKEYTAKTNDKNNFSIVSIPQALTGYLGHDGLSRDKLKGKIFKNAYITEKGEVFVTYETLILNSEPEVRSFVVNLFNDQIGIGQTESDIFKAKRSKYIYR